MIAGYLEAVIKEYNGMYWHCLFFKLSNWFHLGFLLTQHTLTHTPVVIKSSCHQEHIPGRTCQSHYLPPSPRRTLWHTSEQLGQIIGNLPWPCPIIKTTNYWPCSALSLSLCVVHPLQRKNKTENRCMRGGLKWMEVETVKGVGLSVEGKEMQFSKTFDVRQPCVKCVRSPPPWEIFCQKQHS